MGAIETAAVGDIVSFGPYEWLVIAKEESRAMLITRDSIDQGTKYNETMARTYWENCTLRTWLNGEFLDRFSEADRERILQVEVGDSGNPKFELDGGNATSDKVFCLSAKEAKALMDDDQRKASANWWIRTPGYVSMHAVCVFSDSGGVYLDGYSVNTGNFAVRPALWVSCEVV